MRRVSNFAFAAALCLVWVVVGVGNSFAAPKPTVAILGLEVKDDGSGGGIDQKTVKVARGLTEALRGAAGRSGSPYTVAAGSDKEQVDMELYFGCDDVPGKAGLDCVAKIGAKLAGDYLVYGGVTKQRGGYQVSLTLLAVVSKTRVRSVTDTLPSKDVSTADLERAGKDLYVRLVGAAPGSVVVECSVPGVVVLDGQSRGRLTNNSVKIVDVTAGSYRVGVLPDGSGYKPFERSVRVEAGEETIVECQMEKSSVVEPPSAKAGTGKGPGAEGAPDLRGRTIEGTTSEKSSTLGWAMVGAGVTVGLAGGGFVLYNWCVIDSEGGCKEKTSPEAADRARSRQWIGWGGVAVGGVATVAGLYLVYSAKSAASEETSAGSLGRRRRPSSLAVTPILAPDGGGASVRIDF